MSDFTPNSNTASVSGNSQTCESSSTMAASLDVHISSSDCFGSGGWRHSLEPLTPSAQHVDVLDEFLASWDDELLSTGDPTETGNCSEGRPMMALLQSTVTSSASLSPRRARLVHAHGSLPANQSVHASRSATNAASPTSSSSGSEKGVATVQPEVVVPARKRIRRKVEIAQLRDEGAFLEKKLHELREYWKSAPEKFQQQQRRTNAVSDDNEEALTCAEPLWKQIAHSQKELLTESEQKNQELKQEYVLQRKLARELRKLLLKRAMEPAVFDTALYLLQPRSPLQVLNKSHQTFERLLNDTGPLYAEFEHAARIMRSRCAKNLTFRDWQCHEDTPPKPIFLDLVDSYTLPFNHLEVNMAMRNYYGENNTTNTEKHLCEFFECSEATMFRQALYAYSNERRSGHIRHKQVVRNFIDDAQSVFLVITLMQPATSTGEPISGITLREQKWTIIRSGHGGNAATSTVQSYHRITQEHVDRDYEVFWTRQMIMDAMVPMWNSSLQAERRRLESFLIDQSMRSSRPPKRGSCFKESVSIC